QIALPDQLDQDRVEIAISELSFRLFHRGAEPEREALRFLLGADGPHLRSGRRKASTTAFSFFTFLRTSMASPVSPYFSSTRSTSPALPPHVPPRSPCPTHRSA